MTLAANLRRFAWTLVPLMAAAASLRAQCSKPTIPASGLTTATAIDVALTYSDGYKTLCNLTYPSSTAPTCGWPLVVFVHGYGGRRSIQRAIASRGFAVLAQDVRGQGTAKTLNSTTMGMTFYGATEKYDLAELIAFARTKWNKLIDPSKLAVTGASQGGIHSWFAAAYSGRKISITGRGTITFPKVDCVAPQNFIADASGHSLRGGTLFAVDALNRAFGGNNAAVLDPALLKLLGDKWLKQDPVGLAQTLAAQPGRPVEPLMKTCTVPILFVHAYMDKIQSPREAMRVIETMPNTTPMRSILSTIGHGSPGNGYEDVFRTEERIRWFDRYLWNILNGVETDARAVMGVMPLDSSLTTWSSLWEHRFDASFRPADVAMSRYYLRADGSLAQSPGTAGKSTVITHRVAGTYTPALVKSSPVYWQTNTILTNVPLSQRTFTMGATTTERELAGRAKVDLEVTPSATRFHLTALLTAKVPGQAQPYMIANWGKGVIGAKVNTPMRLSFELGPSYCVLPKGSILQLSIRNHWLREYPMRRLIVTMPYFVSGTTNVSHGTGTKVSFVDIPFRRVRGIGLVAKTRTDPLPNLRNVVMQIRGGTTAANRPYIVAAGLSGPTPGTPLTGGILPLRWDPLSDAVLALTLGNAPVVPGFMGSLDSLGRGNAVFKLSTYSPGPSALVGQRLTFAAWMHASATNLTGRGSNPVDVIFR